MNDLYWMEKAYEQALIGQSQGEVPIGAVVVGVDNQLLAAGFNTVRSQCDPTAHAEINALRAGAKHHQNHRLGGTTVYTTLEPCCMCAGALVHARIKRLVFAVRDPQAGAAGSVYNLMAGFPLNHAIQIDEGILEYACASLLKDFFKERR